MHYTAEDVELWNEKQKEKIQNTNEGFTDYIQVQSRKHRKQVAKLRPNLSAYREIKEAEAKADAEGRSLAFSLLESRPTLEAIENVILDLKEQYVCYHFSKPLTFNKIRKRDRKRNTFSRRRTFDENDDVYVDEQAASGCID